MSETQKCPRVEEIQKIVDVWKNIVPNWSEEFEAKIRRIYADDNLGFRQHTPEEMEAFDKM